MHLSGRQRKELQEALVSAFPNKTDLEQMLSFELEKDLNYITGGDNLKEIMFQLIKKAVSEEWVKDLVRAARKTNPGNSKLQAIAQELLNDSTNINLPDSIPHCAQATGIYQRMERTKMQSDVSSQCNVLDDIRDKKDLNISKTNNIGAALFAIAFIGTMITMFIMFLQLSPSDISFSDSTGNSNPKREQPDQEILSNQDHHSLSPENSKTKAPNLKCSYENLRNQLKFNKFKEADITTLNLMRLITNQQNKKSLDRDDILNIDCQNFYKIDSCWKQKNPNFGFSVQSQIWKEIRDKQKVANNQIYDLFAKRVGWNVQEETFFSQREVTCDYSNDEKNIPQGNLPCEINVHISGQAPAYIQEKIDKCQ